jgi:hypothetical protein
MIEDTRNKDNKIVSHNGFKSIRIYLTEMEYERIISDNKYFKERLNFNIEHYPDLFPEEIKNGYRLFGLIPKSKKQSLAVRRIQIKGMKNGIFQIYPSFVMPYMTELTGVAWKILLLGMYRVPDWVLAKVFDKDEKHIQRLKSHLGNCSLVGSTVKGQTSVPKDIVADEKHSRLQGAKAYIATISANDCFLCAGVTDGADEIELTKAYNVFAEEACDVETDYQATSANTDGWKATGVALKNVLGSTLVVINCFLHAVLSIKNVTTKKTAKLFSEVKNKVWNIYRAKNKQSFSQKIRRLREWSESISDVRIKEKVLKLCKKKDSFIASYDFDNAYRTSNMVDRLMDFLDKFLYNRKYMKGKKETAQKSITAFCITHNFRPYAPETEKRRNVRSPFEKMNGFQYHNNWLENMLIATSRNGFRKNQQKKT